jgi:signal transduction histidine kinase/CHASE3 domain sensor protein
MDRQHETSNLVTRSYIVKVTLNQFLIYLTDAGTSHRSYLLTRDTEFMLNYQLVMQKAQALLPILDSLTFGSETQQENLARLKASMNKNALALHTNILLPRVPSPGASTLANPPVDNVDNMISNTRDRLQKMHLIIQSMVAEEDDILSRRIGERNGSMRTDPFVLLPIFLMMMALMLLVYYKLKKETLLSIDSQNNTVKYLWVTGKHIFKSDNDLKVGKTDALLHAGNEQESVARFKTLADSMPQIVWTADTNGDIDYFNQRWYDYVKTSASASFNLAGKYPNSENDWTDHLHPGDVRKFFFSWQASLKSGQPLQAEVRLMDYKAGDEYCWFLAKALPIYDNNRKIIKWHGTFTDINDLKRAELSIQQMAKQKEDFISIASHELKTPVTSLKGSIQLISRISESCSLPDEVLPLVDMASRRVNKLTRMVGDLLDVSKMDTGKMDLVKVNFPLRAAIEDSMEQVRPLSRRHVIGWQGPAGLTVHANKERIEQVLTNFLSNAVKYSEDGSKISIIASVEDQYIKVAVTDRGIGIPADKIPFVFDRFFRVERTSDRFSGLGLGLYISSEIISLHGGRIGVTSELRKGSTFWFTLPKE